MYQNRRWDSDFLTLRALLDSGEIGTVLRYESRFEVFKPETGAPAAGGGTLVDFGSHLVDQALVLSGPVESVYAEMHHREDKDGLDDDVFVALTHRNGVQSHLWGSWRQGARGPRPRVTGTTGTLVIDHRDSQDRALMARATPQSEGDNWGTEPEDLWGRFDAETPSSPSLRTAAGGTSSIPLSLPRFAVRGLFPSTPGMRWPPPPSWTPRVPVHAMAGWYACRDRV
ncbi:Gfo/Idh/MocA family protein [Streptomyces sp. RLB3-6]|uniref:Gfo/Idh/MocA family protein n=1 Tax=Streptomyces mirabilis TaxID=68239 RepID=UPI001F07C4D6|nr:Gfo/Idh/MocA family oxidoreductase [Streptomyces sp. RLB3-6]